MSSAKHDRLYHPVQPRLGLPTDTSLSKRRFTRAVVRDQIINVSGTAREADVLGRKIQGRRLSRRNPVGGSPLIDRGR